MKKKVFRERYNTLTINQDKHFTFEVDDVDINAGYKEGAIEKMVKDAIKSADKKVRKAKKGDK